ncbi:MAG: maltodextrin glucosidase [Piscinibacter sp.]|nr:maltodextrin glucosidase [Piscinibacter sp.]
MTHPAIAPWLVREATGCRVVLLTDRADPEAVFLRTLPDNEEALLPMRPAGRHGALHAWEAALPWDGGNLATRYAFKVLTRGTQHWLAADGAHAHCPPESLHFRVHPDLPPAWVREQVFYQVFPDRFARAVDGHDALPWNQPLPVEALQTAFFGGDLDGLVARLDHLQLAVGASAVYLNPVFSAGSNHRYDTEDYDQVDPRLGGNEALVRLREALDARGMRLVLDAVLNHTGAGHPWLADDRARWYARDAQGRPLGWKGHASLPVLDFAEPALRDAVYEGRDAIVRRWLRPPYAIDGWRLDVIHMLGEGPGAHHNAEHVRGIRRAIKDENPQAYVLGEHFFEATRWLQGDQEDGAMNYYGFAQPLWAWLAGVDVAGHPIVLDAAGFDAWMTRARAAIPYEHQLVQLNLVGSHDTPRLLTRLGGDLALMHVALTLLFTVPGVPCLYYGDEVGMEGGADPDCRRCMDWTQASWRPELLAHVRELASLRRARPEWRDGAVQTLAAGSDWLLFARYTAQAVTLVGVNRGVAVDVDVPLDTLPIRVTDGALPRRLQLPERGSVLRFAAAVQA